MFNVRVANSLFGQFIDIEGFGGHLAIYAELDDELHFKEAKLFSSGYFKARSKITIMGGTSRDFVNKVDRYLGYGESFLDALRKGHKKMKELEMGEEVTFTI